LVAVAPITCHLVITADNIELLGFENMILFPQNSSGLATTYLVFFVVFFSFGLW